MTDAIERFEALLDPVLRQALGAMTDELLVAIQADPVAARPVFTQVLGMIDAGVRGTRTRREATRIEGPGGDLPVYITRPTTAGGPRPAVLWAHGGGYVVGTADEPTLPRVLAAGAQVVVVAPEYRLAPEHRAPAAVEDCAATLAWMHANAEQLGIDPTRIIVGGNSAGGGIAASLALYTRDHGGPPIHHQFLLYPMLDDTHDSPAAQLAVHPAVWNLDISRWAWSQYLNEGKPSPYAAAARAGDLRGLPPAYVCVGGVDLFRDECVRYASRLMAADVPVRLEVAPGLFHGAEGFVWDAPVSARFRDAYVSALSRAAHG